MRRALMVAALLGGLAACASGGGGVAAARPSGEVGAASATTAVQRFLELANARDYAGMGWLFGTRQGPFAAGLSARDAELRMYLFACLLRHDRAELIGERSIPGSTGSALRYDAVLTRGALRDTVPFTAVLGPQQRWFVQSVDTEVLTRSDAALSRECAPSARSQ